MSARPMPERDEAEALETRDWLDSIEYVVRHRGPERAGSLLEQLQTHLQARGFKPPFSATTPYINTIPLDEQPPFPGSPEIERRIKSMVRWNALAMVVRANREADGIGGHISTFASAATLYEVGFNHFFRGQGRGPDGDIVYFQGHAAPGIYARAFLLKAVSGRATGKLSPRAETRRRAFLLSASLADARLLGVPHRLHGPEPDDGHLPGSL